MELKALGALGVALLPFTAAFAGGPEGTEGIARFSVVLQYREKVRQELTDEIESNHIPSTPPTSKFSPSPFSRLGPIM